MPQITDTGFEADMQLTSITWATGVGYNYYDQRVAMSDVLYRGVQTTGEIIDPIDPAAGGKHVYLWYATM
jgi:hypothetical protein